VFAGQHFLMPAKGAAISSTHLTFPRGGSAKKAAPSLLSGVPIVVKPASPTAWLAHRMVEDIVKAGILPSGTISIVCGSARELLDHVREEEHCFFYGLGGYGRARSLSSKRLAHSVRVNIEADSINSAILGPDCRPGTELFDLLIKEVVRE